MIKLQVIGNLGKDCTVNNVNGKNVINFNVAHTEKYKDSQGVQKERTTWVECAYWTERMGLTPFLKKGTQVYVEGTPEVRIYTTQDGRHGASLSLRIQNVQLLGSKSGTDGNTETASSYQSSTASAPPPSLTTVPSPTDITEPVDDLPF